MKRVRVYAKCGKCAYVGSSLVHRYGTETVADVAKRHGDATRRACVDECRYQAFTSPASLSAREGTQP